MKRLIKRILHELSDKIFDVSRKLRISRKKKKLKNEDFTIICSDCIGGVIYHEFGLRFRSPTINLYMTPSDFIKFADNLDYYLSQKLVKLPYAEHILGKIDDIQIHFLHYKTFKEAKDKWESRKKLVNKDNICLILTCKDGYTQEDIKNFSKLKYKNKVVFTTEKDNKYSCSYCIKNSVKDNNVMFLGTKANHFGKKYIDDFDIVSFLNNARFK